MIKLYNSLSHRKEEFRPIDPENVRMYVCGPTVYSRAHLGNARAVVVFDILYRLLIHEYGKESVSYVRNITDVDDKINAEALSRNISIRELTEETAGFFDKDMSALGCMKPDIEPRATEHITEMISLIETLIEKDFAYEAEKHVLFRVKSDVNYGHLSRRNHEEMIAGSRIEVAPYKEDAGDFILWKPSSGSEPGWESPWGFGRPGWHIECSAMSTKYLGKDFDIHGGGADLQFPHHENEIAQACCANEGSKYAKYWVHNGFLTVEGQKMSKSLGNFITPEDLLEKEELPGEVIRFVLMSAHYKKPLNWTRKILSDCKKSLDYFYKIIFENNGFEKKCDYRNIPEEFLDAVRDDMNLPLAISILHKLAKKTEAVSGQEKEDLLLSFLSAGQFIGLMCYEDYPKDCIGSKKKEISLSDKEEIENFIEERKQARLMKNWELSDLIRDKLKSRGIDIKDNPDGSTSWSQS